MLYGGLLKLVELSKLTAFYKLAAFYLLEAFYFLATEFQKGISLKILLFINTMECKGVIKFGYIHDYLEFGMNMF